MCLLWLGQCAHCFTYNITFGTHTILMFSCSHLPYLLSTEHKVMFSLAVCGEARVPRLSSKPILVHSTLDWEKGYLSIESITILSIIMNPTPMSSALIMTFHTLCMNV